jgi:hypothetical protein
VAATSNPLRSNEANVTELRPDLTEENRRLRATVDEMQLRLAELEKLADCDTLTPLPNRRAFVREVERVLRQVERYGTPAALLYVDVNSLKSINDRFGTPRATPLCATSPGRSPTSSGRPISSHASAVTSSASYSTIWTARRRRIRPSALPSASPTCRSAPAGATSWSASPRA